MSFAFVVYAISILTDIITAFTMFIIVAIIAQLFELHSSFENNKNCSTKPFWIAVILSIILAFIPSKQTGYLMAGAYVAQNVVESDTSKEIIELIRTKIKKEVQEINTEEANEVAKKLAVDKVKEITNSK